MDSSGFNDKATYQDATFKAIHKRREMVTLNVLGYDIIGKDMYTYANKDARGQYVDEKGVPLTEADLAVNGSGKTMRKMNSSEIVIAQTKQAAYDAAEISGQTGVVLDDKGKPIKGADGKDIKVAANQNDTSRMNSAILALTQAVSAITSGMGGGAPGSAQAFQPTVNAPTMCYWNNTWTMTGK
jgi:hypothetical protein